MIAVDDDPRPTGLAERRKLFDAIEQAPAAEQHLADEDEVVRTGLCGFEEAFGKTIEWLDGNPLDHSFARFLRTRELAAGAVELALGGQHPHGPG